MATEPQEQTGQQIAPVPPPRTPAALEAQPGGVMAILPTTIEEAQRYATGLIRAGIVPDSFKFSKDVLATPEQIEQGAPPVLHRAGTINEPLVLMGVLKVMELGVAPQTGLGGLLPLNGRFTVWGDLAAGLVQNGGKVSNQTAVRVGPAFDPDAPLGEWPKDYGWEVRYWRVGQTDPYIGRFTVRDAQRANLWLNASRKPWIMYPDRMLFNRARAFALRDGFADALMGLGIAEEVMDSLPPVEEEVKRIETKRALLTDDEPETEPQEAATAPEPENGTPVAGEPENAPEPATEPTQEGDGSQPSLLP